MSLPDKSALESALRAAGSAHHDYEQVTLKGEHDKLWAGFYAAYVLGRCGDFASSSALNNWLVAAPAGDDWASSAAAYVISELD